MLTDIKFSIIIAAYNNTDTIRRCLDSVYNQTYKNYEVILVDDCSPNVTYDYLKEFYDKIKIIRLPVNKGAGVARQTGLDNASGDLVLFIDQDDELFSEESLSEVIELYTQFPDAKMIRFAFIKFYNNKWINVHDLDIRPLHGLVFNMNFIKENNIRFHESLRMYEDTYFYLINKFIIHHKYPSVDNALLISPDVIYKYYEYDNSITLRVYGDYSFFEYSLYNLVEMCTFIYDNFSNIIDKDDIQDLLVLPIIYAAFMYYITCMYTDTSSSVIERKRFRAAFCCTNILSILAKDFNIDNIQKLQEKIDARFSTEAVGNIRIPEICESYHANIRSSLNNVYEIYTDYINNRK